LDLNLLQKPDKKFSPVFIFDLMPPTAGLLELIRGEIIQVGIIQFFIVVDFDELKHFNQSLVHC
jgi:hypothetical protein